MYECPYLQGQKVVDSHGADVTGGYELPNMGVENRTQGRCKSITSFLFIFICLYLCVGALLTCMPALLACLTPSDTWKRHGFLQSRIADGLGVPMWVLEINQSPLEEEPGPLYAEPSLQPLFLICSIHPSRVCWRCYVLIRLSDEQTEIVQSW